MSPHEQRAADRPGEENRVGLSGKEFAALQALFATISTYEVIEPVLEKRTRTLAAPGAWRDLRMLRSVSDRVCRRLLDTVPTRKLRQTLMTFDHTRVYVKEEAPGIATMDPTSWSYVPTGALDDLLNTVLGDHCMFCELTEKEGRKCPYRQSIEACVPHDIRTTRVPRESDRCKYADLSIGLNDLEEVSC